MYIIIYDVGTSNVKTGLFDIDSEVRLVAGASASIETIDNPQSVGAMGAALTVAAGIRGGDVLELSQRLVKANHSYLPDPGNKEVYERNYQVFKRLYRDNAAGLRALNA